MTERKKAEDMKEESVSLVKAEQGCCRGGGGTETAP